MHTNVCTSQAPKPPTPCHLHKAMGTGEVAKSKWDTPFILYTFPDDAYKTCDPVRVSTNVQVLPHAFRRHANIDLNLGTMRAWNAASEEPPGLTQLPPHAQAGSPVWVLAPPQAGQRQAHCVQVLAGR